MCDLDFDEPASAWSNRLTTRARKSHRCDTCNTTIAAGESYVTLSWVAGGHADSEKQCLRCRTIGLAFEREHGAWVTPSSSCEFLEQCLDEERWAVDEDEADDDLPVMRSQLPSRLSDEGLRWKYAMEEIRARRATAREERAA